MVIAGLRGPAVQLWLKFTGAIVDPVVGAGTVAILRIGYRRSPNRDFFSPFFDDRYNRPEFDDEQFAALFNELQARGDRAKLMRLFGA